MIMVEITKLEWMKTELINALRWEEDGGKIFEVNDSLRGQQLVQSRLLKGGGHHTSLQWNEQFVIRPFQAGTRIDLIKRKPPKNRPGL